MNKRNKQTRARTKHRARDRARAKSQRDARTRAEADDGVRELLTGGPMHDDCPICRAAMEIGEPEQGDGYSCVVIDSPEKMAKVQAAFREATESGLGISFGPEDFEGPDEAA